MSANGTPSGPVTTVGRVELSRSGIRKLCEWVTALREAFPESVDAEEHRNRVGLGRPMMGKVVRVSRDAGLCRRLPYIGSRSYRAAAPPFGTSRSAWIDSAEIDVLEVLR